MKMLFRLFLIVIVISITIISYTTDFNQTIDKIIFILLCIFFISMLSITTEQIREKKSKPSTVLGFFYILCFFIIILSFLIWDYNRLHILWIIIVIYLLSLTQTALRIGFILFNIACSILRRPNVINENLNDD